MQVRYAKHQLTQSRAKLRHVGSLHVQSVKVDQEGQSDKKEIIILLEDDF